MIDFSVRIFSFASTARCWRVYGGRSGGRNLSTASSSSSAPPKRFVVTPDAVSPPSSRDGRRLCGVITEWNFVNRTGRVKVHQQQQRKVVVASAGASEEAALRTTADQRVTSAVSDDHHSRPAASSYFAIRGAHCFETVMPTFYRDLVCANVTFVPVVPCQNQAIRSVTAPADGAAASETRNLNDGVDPDDDGGIDILREMGFRKLRKPQGAGPAARPKDRRRATTAMELSHTSATARAEHRGDARRGIADDGDCDGEAADIVIDLTTAKADRFRDVPSSRQVPPSVRIKDLRHERLFDSPLMSAGPQRPGPLMPSASATTDSTATTANNKNCLPSAAAPAAMGMVVHRPHSAGGLPYSDKTPSATLRPLDSPATSSSATSSEQHKVGPSDRVEAGWPKATILFNRGHGVVRVRSGVRLRGRIVAWQAFMRTGLIEVAAGSPATSAAAATGLIDSPGGAAIAATSASSAYVIANANAFLTALPTSFGRDVLLAEVEFEPVIDFDLAAAEEVVKEGVAQPGEEPTEGRAASAVTVRIRPTAEPRQRTAEGIRITALATASTPPSVVHPDATTPASVEALSRTRYGVITRWSGGQGAIEASTGDMYFIEDELAFTNLVDPRATALRGSVVQFQLRQRPPPTATAGDGAGVSAGGGGSGVYASAVTVLSDLGAVPASVIGGRSEAAGGSGGEGGTTTDATSPSVPTIEVLQADLHVHRAIHVPCLSGGHGEDGADRTPTRRRGTVVSYNHCEGLGVVQELAEGGERFVIRSALTPDAAEHCQKSGAHVLFTVIGKIASDVAPWSATPPSTVTEEDPSAGEGAPPRQHGTREKGAAASPPEAVPEVTQSSAAYWIARFDAVGIDSSPLRRIAQPTREDRSASPPPDGQDADDDDGENLDWFKDPRKNRKVKLLGGGEGRFSDVSMLSPTSIMQLGMTARDPKKLAKKTKKLEAKLSPAMREEAMQKARSAAPKYMDRIRQARERGEEPNFTFV